MQNKRQSRELAEVNKILRGLPEIKDIVNKQLDESDNLDQFMTELFTVGMRLSKYRMQLGRIQSTKEIDHYITEAKTQIDILLEIVVHNAGLIHNFVKETKK